MRGGVGRYDGDRVYDHSMPLASFGPAVTKGTTEGALHFQSVALGGGERDEGKSDLADSVYHFFPLTEGLVTVTVNVGTKEGYRKEKEDRLDTRGRQNNPQCSCTRLTYTALSSLQ